MTGIMSDRDPQPQSPHGETLSHASQGDLLTSLHHTTINHSSPASPGASTRSSSSTSTTNLLVNVTVTPPITTADPHVDTNGTIAHASTTTTNSITAINPTAHATASITIDRDLHNRPLTSARPAAPALYHNLPSPVIRDERSSPDEPDPVTSVEERDFPFDTVRPQLQDIGNSPGFSSASASSADFIALLHPQSSPTMATTRDGVLPENDGMSVLREQLQEIKLLALSTEEKARRMHELMTKDYLSRTEGCKHHHHHHRHDHSSVEAHQDVDMDIATPPVVEQAPDISSNPYKLLPGDTAPSFSPLPVRTDEVFDDSDEAISDEEVPDLGCVHYKRNVKIQCYDCERWFPCRHCHDSAKDLPYPHTLDRKRTKNMLCMFCCTPQPAGEQCIQCGEYAAWYYCNKCKLWENDPNKRIYHCDDCGICRVGEGLGKDFVHCRKCNVCISIANAASHACLERATESNCPLCLVYLFDSRTPVVSLPCGHYMHGDCYKDLMSVTYKCPVCSKSAVNMELQWKKLDDEIQAQPMPDDEEGLDGLLPPEYRNAERTVPGVVATDGVHQPRPRDVWVGCNDCSRRSWTPFHWLGLKCQRCDSYNTCQLAPTTGVETEAERILRQQQNHRQHDFTGDAVLRDAGIGVVDEVETVDNTLHVPKSPPNQPPTPTSPSFPASAHSPRRYFVQEEMKPRASSFNAPRFPTPSLPNLPNLPNLPSLSDMPSLPRMPRMPKLADLPNLPDVRRSLQHMPDFPRLSAYDMFSSISRSLSPMRYYLNSADRELPDGLTPEVRSNRRRFSVRSDPTRTYTSSKLRTASGSSVDNTTSNPFDSDLDLTSKRHTEISNAGGKGVVGSVKARVDLSEDESEEDDDSDVDMLADEDELADGAMGRADIEIFGHR